MLAQPLKVTGPVGLKLGGEALKSSLESHGSQVPEGGTQGTRVVGAWVPSQPSQNSCSVALAVLLTN